MSEHSKVSEAFKIHEHFCKSMLDAYAVVDKSGKVLKCNQLLSTILGVKSRQILKAESLDQLISFQIDDEILSIQKILKESVPSRLDEVKGHVLIDKGSNDASLDLNLIIGVYPFLDNEEVIGAFLLIRDVTAETNLQGKYKVKATQSITDKLTGLYNRAYFESYLPSTLKSLAEGNSEKYLSLIMADIDHFKMINDTYGHQAGDFILEGVAEKFKENFRKTDIICRYGGEEFLAILPATDSQGAIQAAEKFRSSVATHVFDFNNTTISVTISLGIAQAKIGQESAEEIIARADHALYHAKYSGRNRVCVHQGDDLLEIIKPEPKS